jgi:hypothetical protein
MGKRLTGVWLNCWLAGYASALRGETIESEIDKVGYLGIQTDCGVVNFRSLKQRQSWVDGHDAALKPRWNNDELFAMLRGLK